MYEGAGIHDVITPHLQGIPRYIPCMRVHHPAYFGKFLDSTKLGMLHGMKMGLFWGT